MKNDHQADDLANIRRLTEYADDFSRLLAKLRLARATYLTLGLKDFVKEYDQILRDQEGNSRDIVSVLKTCNDGIIPRDFSYHVDQVGSSLSRAERQVDITLSNARELRLKGVGNPRPHLLAEVITRLVVDKRSVDRVLDCRAEVFLRNHRSKGPLRAHAYYWSDTVRSSWPKIKKIAPWAMVLEALRRGLGH